MRNNMREIDSMVMAAKGAKASHSRNVWVRFSEVLFFFQAEHRIRYWSVTGVQTCALPIYLPPLAQPRRSALQCRTGAAAPVVEDPADQRPRGLRRADSLRRDPPLRQARDALVGRVQIGRASCRERV